MLYSGEEIREAALKWLEDPDVPELMKTDGYYAYREGCKEMQHAYWSFLMENELIKNELLKIL